MRIGLLGPAYPLRGGIAHYTTLLYRALQARHRVCFLSFRSQYPRWVYPGRTDLDQSAAPLGAEGAQPLIAPFDVRSWLAAIKVLRGFRPVLTILPWWTPFWTVPYVAIVAGLRRAGFGRILFLCHNVVGHERRLLHRWASMAVLRQGQAFIVHSEEEARVLQAMIPQATVRWVPHPSYAHLGRTSISRQEARQRLGLRGPILLFFGFVRPYKGLRDLLAALPAVLARHQVTLLVVGEFWEPLVQYQRLARSLGVADAVRFIDRYVPNEEVPLYFAAADLVVLPYRSVTGSGVVQLALGCERPVVVTRTGSLPHTIEDGWNGFLVPPADPPSLAQAILRFLDLSPGEQAAFCAAIASQQDRYSWEQLVVCVEELAMEIGDT